MSGFEQSEAGESPASRPGKPIDPDAPKRTSFGFPGRPTDAHSRDVAPSDKTASDGTASDGTASDGTASDGTASDGTASDGTASDGTASDGTASDGTTDDGTNSLRDEAHLAGPTAPGGIEEAGRADASVSTVPVHPVPAPTVPAPGLPASGRPAPAPASTKPAQTFESRTPAPSPAVETEAPRMVSRATPRIIAIANQKGGVGKTTTTVNLGAAAAELGHRVLVVDLDPQGNASTGLGINPRSLEASMYDVLLHDVPIDEAIEAAEVRNLFVAPANLDLAGAEIELVPAFSRELRLKNALAAVDDDFDLILIDCPPSLGLLTVNAFSAATEVLVPIQCEYYALEGLGQLLRNVDLVKRNLNAALELSAIVLVMYDARTNLANQVASEVREHFGSKVCRSVIPRNIRLSEAPSFGQPITVFDPSSRGAIAYRDLAKEVAGESA